jgi:hypothetical protein
VSSSNLLKTFGKGANVALQLANDKALRRKSTGTVRGFDITSGELIEGISTINGSNPVPHNLRREAKGAIILSATDPAGGAGEIFCESADAKQVVIRANDVFDDVVIWVV